VQSSCQSGSVSFQHVQSYLCQLLVLWVLCQVDPSADDSLIKRQYRKLALLLHPDKNKSVGAEAAFKLIGEAFGVLSDKSKRNMHDLKRGFKGSVPQMPTRVSETAKPHSSHHPQYQSTAQASAGSGPQAPHPSLTFWTSCPLCRMQYQYLRTYLNFQLLCQKCNKPFTAKDINATSANGAKVYTWSHDINVQHQTGRQDYKFQGAAQGNGASGTATGNGNAHAHGDSHTAAASKSAAAAVAAQNLVHEMYQKAKRDRLDAERESKRKEKEREKAQKQQEKEAVKKARDEAKSKEALERLLSKRKHAADKESKRKTVERGGLRRLSRKRSKKEDEVEDEDDEDEKLDQNESAGGIHADSSGVSTRKLTPRRSARNRRNVTYRIDGSDDELEGSPNSKRPRLDVDGSGFGNVSRVEKGKSVVDDNDDDDDDQDTWVIGREGDGKVSYKDGIVKEGSSGSALSKERPVEDFRQNPAAKFRNPNSGLKKPSAGEKDGVEQESLVKETPGAWSDTKMEGDVKISNRKAISISEDKLEKGTRSSGLPDRISKVSCSLKSEEDINLASSPTSSADSEAALCVMDPDFHDFDADRTESDVRKDQFWAVYDEQDGMPRYYCKITKVSQHPFTVSGYWLESVQQTEPNNTWLNTYDLSLSIGEFKIGDAVEFDTINMFSHVMTPKKNLKVFEVYPRVNEVWAMYRDFDNEVPKSKSDGKFQFRYDMVVVKKESTNLRGPNVVLLKKMEDYKTLWRPVGDAISADDLPRFSHRVPSQQITANEIPGVPEGCLELDPASTPADVIES
jgi:hypothetical protein